jgi:hypothetical protein
LATGDIQRGHDGERGAVADLSLESRKARVRENGDRAGHHPPYHGGYVLGAVRDVGRRDPKPEKGPLHPVADRPTRLGVISATWRSISCETQEILVSAGE